MKRKTILKLLLILFIITIMADIILTNISINKFGTKIESNKFVRKLYEQDQVWIWIIIKVGGTLLLVFLMFFGIFKNEIQEIDKFYYPLFVFTIMGATITLIGSISNLLFLL